MGDLQPLASPNTLDPLVVDCPTRLAQELGDLAIAIMGVTAEFTVGCTDALTEATTMVPILLRTTATMVLRTTMDAGIDRRGPIAWNTRAASALLSRRRRSAHSRGSARRRKARPELAPAHGRSYRAGAFAHTPAHSRGLPWGNPGRLGQGHRPWAVARLSRRLRRRRTCQSPLQLILLTIGEAGD